ncbi:MAG: hypothetical protein O7G85_01045 [Planctomycetota bacterium]|nr:hypothetical protein [Planctomycetota bacterium]
MSFLRHFHQSKPIDPIPPIKLGHPTPPARWMSSDEVLQVLIDTWRNRKGIDANPDYDIPLKRSSNVEEAINHLGIGRLHDDWPTIAVYFKRLFNVHIEYEQWKSVLDSKKEKTLGPVCDLIAEHALAPLIEREFDSVMLSWPAACYRTLLLLLNDLDIVIQDMTPDSLLAPLLRKHPKYLSFYLPRLSPGRLPALRKMNRLSYVVYGFGFATLLLFPVSHLMGLIIHPEEALILFVIFVVGLMFAKSKRMTRWKLGDLRTVSDLCHALVSPPPEDSEPCYWKTGKPILWDKDHRPDLQKFSEFLHPKPTSTRY